MSDKIFDIGIIGYGPVGATLSGLLSSLGLSVVVIEKIKELVQQLEQLIQILSNLEHLIFSILQLK